jgi:glutaredoxin 3
VSSPNVIIYGNASCPFCGAARMLLTKKSVEFENISVTGDASLLEEMQQKSGRRSVPQIFIDDYHVGGFEELDALNRSGELDKLLAD